MNGKSPARAPGKLPGAAVDRNERGGSGYLRGPAISGAFDALAISAVSLLFDAS